jgi:M3 family oligoendopeptidase
MIATPHLPDLAHRAPEPTFLPDLPEVLEAEWISDRYDDLLMACTDAGDDPASWITVVRWYHELESFLSSRFTVVRTAYRQDTEDEAVTAEYQRLNRELSPVAADKGVEVARAIVSSQARDAIAEEFGELFVRKLTSEVETHDPVNTRLRTELSDVLMRYTRIFATATVMWRGERHPFSFARKAMHDPDQRERHAAHRSKVEYVQRHEDELQAIFDEARTLRTRMAVNLGLGSYTELRYREMERFDWSPREAASVRAAIRDHVVPLTHELRQRQAAAQGSTLVHPADEEIWPDQPQAEMIVEVDGQIEAATEMFGAMGEEFSGAWDLLVSEDLIDLPARAGKGTGAFCTSFAYEGVPFVFCNSVGTPEDVKTLVHEFGHALQGWRSRDIVPVHMRSPTLEACEIHSMTLELLVHPFMATFFGSDADAFKLEHLRSTLLQVPYMAAIDEFQHEVYAMGLDAAGRGDLWERLAGEFLPGFDWSSEPWLARNRWLTQLHVFQYPFYYLDYALARLVSWELWLRSLDDRDGAIATYLELCSLGGTKPFRQLVTEAGLGDPFDGAVIERTVQRMRPHLGLD